MALNDQTDSSGGIPDTSLVLIREAIARDATAWTRFVPLYMPLVRYWCMNAGLRGADIDDVCQETFLGSLSALRSYRPDGEKGSFRRWLWGVTRNRIRRFRSREANQPCGAGGDNARSFLESQRDQIADDPNAIEIDETSSKEAQKLYFRALELVRGDFEETTWKAFWMTTVEGHKAPEVAVALGMTSAAVRKAKSRVLQRVHRQIDDPLS